MIEEKLFYITRDKRHFTTKEEAESWEKWLDDEELFNNVKNYFEFNSGKIHPNTEIRVLMRKYVLGETDVFDLLKKDIDEVVEICKKINLHE